jgi:hypothetical protein
MGTKCERGVDCVTFIVIADVIEGRLFSKGVMTDR